MKKIFLVTTIVFTLFSSCSKDGSDLLDPVTTGLSETDVFASPQYSERFLLDIYRQIIPVLAYTDFQGTRWRNLCHLETGTDNGITFNPSINVRDFTSGAWTPSNTNMFWYYDWVTNYSAIRACNLFLSHIDNVPLDPQYNFDEATRKTRKAEGKFLLAFNYAELAKQFGGLPIVTKVVSPTDGDMMVARSTFDETIAYITKLCDEAAADLPPTQPDAQLGRATKGAALALKARMLLYAASPLWNDPANANDTPWSGKYDAKKWETAAKAAADVINLKVYSLYPDIATLFLTRTNSEIIFARMQEPLNYHSATHIPYTLYTGSGAYGVGGLNQVTYNMVKEYEVLKNGVAYSVDDPASGHNFQDPYKNRDPRFYRDCIFNGSKLLLAGVLKTAQFGDPQPGATKSGAHNMPYAKNSSFNSYVYSIKFADPTLNVTWDARSPGGGPRVAQNYPYLRYAEILLNYAEAMNEAFGPNVDPYGTGLTALAAVNEVRTRAKYPAATRVEYLGQTGGMPAIAPGLTKDQMRAKIRHERRVEMSYEEHRLWDVNRWKEVPATDIKAELPTYKADGSLEYQIKTLETRFFDPKMYRMPIPQSEILANPLLVQNPGW